MALNGRDYAPMRFMDVAYRPLGFFSTARVAVYKDSVDEIVDWDPETGNTRTPIDPVWVGWASLTPNKDWRARDRRWAYEDTATHAYRVQLWHIDKNELYPEDQWGDQSLRVKMGEGMMVKVLSLPADPRSVGLRLIVRNAVTDSSFWQPTLLCDVDTGDQNG